MAVASAPAIEHSVWVSSRWPEGFLAVAARLITRSSYPALPSPATSGPCTARAASGLAEADEHRGGTLSPLAAFSEKLSRYKGAWGREKRPLAERQGSPAATQRLGMCQIGRHGRSGSSRIIGCVFLPSVADLQLGATRKRLEASCDCHCDRSPVCSPSPKPME